MPELLLNHVSEEADAAALMIISNKLPCHNEHGLSNLTKLAAHTRGHCWDLHGTCKVWVICDISGHRLDPWRCPALVSQSYGTLVWRIHLGNFYGVPCFQALNVKRKSLNTNMYHVGWHKSVVEYMCHRLWQIFYLWLSKVKVREKTLHV